MRRILLIAVAVACSYLTVSAQNQHSLQTVREAQKLNDRASGLYYRNWSNTDSLSLSLDLLDKAIAIDRTCKNAHENKANILQASSRNDEALKAYDEAIRNVPGNYKFYMDKAFLLDKLGRPYEAYPLHKEALERCEKKANLASFLDYYLLLYRVKGIDTPSASIMAAIPSSFSEENRIAVASFLKMIGSFKQVCDVYMDAFITSHSHSNPAPLLKQRNDGVYYVVDELAHFPGGQLAMLEFIRKNFKEPAGYSFVGKQPFILVSMVVTSDGSISVVTIKQADNKQLEEEAARVIKMMPKWTPAKVDGKPVSMEMIIPFRLGQE